MKGQSTSWMSDKARGNWSLINFKGFLLTHGDGYHHQKSNVLFGNAIKQPGLEPRRKMLPSRKFAEKEQALLYETSADAHLFVNIRWIGEFGGANNGPTAVNTHAAIPGTDLLHQSRKSEWCSLLYSPKNLNIILFNDSVLPDRMLKLEVSFTWKLLEEWMDTLGFLSSPNQI